MFPGECVIAPAADADLLILAGDIASGLGAIRAFANWPVPVLYVPGNHEFYGAHRDALLQAMHDVAQKGSVVLLDRSEADFSRFEHWFAKHKDELQHLRFLGATLWTDYRLPGLNRSQHQQMETAQTHLVDHRAIHTDSGYFTPADALHAHEADRRWLQAQLDTPFDGKTVVITHHGPHRGSTHPRWAGNALNGAFMSHLPELVTKADLWVHGHVHDTFDYVVEKCRVVANPRGYGLNLRGAERLQDVQWENPAFQYTLLAEV